MSDLSRARHLEGWPLGLWLVGVAALTAALVVPRPVEPRGVPEPAVDRVTRARHRRAARARADAVRREKLSHDTRAVGEAFRQLGKSSYRRQGTEAQLQKQLRRLAAVARARDGEESLLSLRAIQSELFVAAGRAYAAGTDPPVELQELGGSLLRRGRSRGWFDHYPDGANEDELAALFALHYSSAIGLDVIGSRFAPTLNEWRVYYRLLLRMPLPEGPERAASIRERLEGVNALARHDSSYPAYLARGILHYQSDDYARAAEQLRLHFDARPHGPWSLRASNYLAACSAKLSR